MLKISYYDNGIKFSVEHNGIVFHFKEWDATDDCIYYMPLSSLVDNGQASFDKTGCLMPYDSIYLFEDYDCLILGLPPFYNKSIRLRSKGMLNSPDFEFLIDFISHVPDGKIVGKPYHGNIIEMLDGTYMMLAESQYEVLKLITLYNQTNKEEKTTNYNLIQFGKIKEAALNAGIELDTYLSNENVFIPDSIDLELGKEGNALTIQPSVKIKNNDKFKSIFQKQRKVLDNYPVSDETGKRTRVVFSPSQKEGLSILKNSNGTFRESDSIQDIINHPTEYFDPGIFNLSEFYSDRVIDLGFYRPKFYPFVSPYKSAWIPEALIEHPTDGTSVIRIENYEELEKLEEAIAVAKEKNNAVVDYNEVKMALEDAVFMADFAKLQLSSPQSKVEIESDENGQRKVLIIEENAEDTGYSVNAGSLNGNTPYTFFRNSNLLDCYELKAHQEEGISWLQNLIEYKVPGCLLADDMGLGKTLQILYFIDWHAQKHPMHRPYLIVAPISLLENWEREYLKFFKHPMDVLRLSSKDVPRKMNKEVIRMMQDCDLILTNYETIRNSQLNFCAVDFDVIVIDEAQKIKTPGTLITNAIKALKGNFRIALTGTPVENSLLDLWCIMDFCVPGLLGNAKEFKRKYENPLRSSDTDMIAIGDEIHSKLGNYFMRRLKKDVAKDLPNKNIIRKSVNMPSVQERFYKSVISEYKNGNNQKILEVIQAIRSISEHPYLYDKSLNSHEIGELIDNAARLQATIVFIKEIFEKNEKVIIFAERRDTQRMLQRLIRKIYGFTPKVINGETPTISSRFSEKLSRQEAIDEFQSRDGFNVIIMSPVAAGMGLNVTGANHVIHYSRHWNPAKENQATDRAYRIGQEKDVYVYYPLAVHQDFQSFDITLDQLLERKSNLASSTIFPTERIEVLPEDFKVLINV